MYEVERQEKRRDPKIQGERLLLLLVSRERDPVFLAPALYEEQIRARCGQRAGASGRDRLLRGAWDLHIRRL